MKKMSWLQYFIRLILFNIFFILSACTHAGASEENSRELTVGIAPYLPAAKLIAQHAPLADYLSKGLAESVVLLDSENYKSFQEYSQKGLYDILITPIHWGRAAESSNLYQRAVKTRQSVFASLVVRKDSTIYNASQLQELHLALPPNHDVVHYLALQTLRDYRVEQGRNLRVEIIEPYSKALNQVLQGNVEAAAIAEQNIEKYLDNPQGKFRIIAASMPMPSFVVMLNSRLGYEKINKIRKLLLSFSQTEVGKTYFKHSGWQAFLPLDNDTFTALDADLLKNF